MTLQGYQKRYLRGLAHTLEPALATGKAGLTTTWLVELDHELERHELLKIRLSSDRDERGAELASVLEHTGALLVASVGRIATLYRASDKAAEPIVIPQRQAEQQSAASAS